jgi:hypothetical protein
MPLDLSDSHAHAIILLRNEVAKGLRDRLTPLALFQCPSLLAHLYDINVR